MAGTAWLSGWFLTVCSGCRHSGLVLVGRGRTVVDKLSAAPARSGNPASEKAVRPSADRDGEKICRRSDKKHPRNREPLLHAPEGVWFARQKVL